jgi:hypothetical protein
MALHGEHIAVVKGVDSVNAGDVEKSKGATCYHNHMCVYKFRIALKRHEN